MTANVAFIGVGNMARAIISGMIASGYAAQNIIGTSRTAEKREAFQQEYGIRMLADNNQAVTEADVVVLCVKPAQMQGVIEGFAEHVRAGQMYISVAAGVELSAIEQWLSTDVAVVRCMPNTPSQLGAGMSGLIAIQLTTAEQMCWVCGFSSPV